MELYREHSEAKYVSFDHSPISNGKSTIWGVVSNNDLALWWWCQWSASNTINTRIWENPWGEGNLVGLMKFAAASMM